MVITDFFMVRVPSYTFLCIIYSCGYNTQPYTIYRGWDFLAVSMLRLRIPTIEVSQSPKKFESFIRLDSQAISSQLLIGFVAVKNSKLSVLRLEFLIINLTEQKLTFLFLITARSIWTFPSRKYLNFFL